MKSKYFFKTFFLSNLRNNGTFRFVSIFKIFRSSFFLRGKVYCCCCRRLLNFIWFTLLLLQMYKLSVNETDEGERYIDFVRDVNSKRFKALWLNKDNYSQIIRNFIPNQSKYGKISHKMLGITLFIDRMTLRRLGSQKFIWKYDFGNKVILVKKIQIFWFKIWSFSYIFIHSSSS